MNKVAELNYRPEFPHCRHTVVEARISEKKHHSQTLISSRALLLLPNFLWILSLSCFPKGLTGGLRHAILRCHRRRSGTRSTSVLLLPNAPCQPLCQALTMSHPHESVCICSRSVRGSREYSGRPRARPGPDRREGCQRGPEECDFSGG